MLLVGNSIPETAMEAKQLRSVLTLLFFGVLMGALDLAIVGPALPAMQADFLMDTRQLSWLFNIYVLFQLVGSPLLAKMSDRFGKGMSLDQRITRSFA